MSGREASAAFLRDVGGGGGSLPMNADGSPNPGPMGLGSNMTMRFRVTGQILDSALYDQAPFFSVLTPAVISSDYELATVLPTASRFTNAQIGDYISLNPIGTRNVNFTGVTGTSASAATSSLNLVIRRYNPFNQNAQDTVYASDKQTAADYQSDRVQIPIEEKLDGYTEINICNDQQAAEVTYTAAWLFGDRLDRRVEVTDRGAAVVVSPSSIR